MEPEEQKRIEDFHQALMRRGLSPTNSSHHRDNLRFFLESYLGPSEGMRLKEVDAETVEYFFLSWYPDRVNGSKTELEGFIPSLKRFYQFLFESGEISEKTLEEIVGALSRKDSLLRRFRSGAPADREAGRSEEEICGELDSPFWIDGSLYFLVRNLEKPRSRIILDFQLFLDYLIHHPLRLTPSAASFPRKDLRRINQMFSEPEALAQNAGQDQSRRLNLFYHLARNLDLFLIGQSSQLLITPRAGRFLDLDSDRQLVILTDALWNRVRWSELQRFGANGFAGWAQEQRGGFAELLSRLPANTLWPISGGGIQDRQTRILLSYLSIYEVVENLIMFGLKEMGILDYQLSQTRDPYLVRNHRGIKCILLTEFGKKVMRYLARKAREEMGVESLMDLLEEGLIFL